MDRIKIKDKYFKPFIPESRIEQAINEVAEHVNADFAGSQDVPVVLCVLNGAIPFTGRLLTKLTSTASWFQSNYPPTRAQSPPGPSST
ncbi:MAG: hypothetical protein MJY57_05580 [Bacteroidales bacterium]|nr:hypothetical protein [Bacteroidales bacterium]